MRLLCLIILVTLTLFPGCKKSPSHRIQSIHSILYTIPDQDRKVLDSFFQLLLRDYDFSYTLFGNKPMSMACYFSQATSWSLRHPSDFLVFEKGWDLWESYSSLFSSHEFVLKRCKDDRGVLGIFLISKSHALQAISDHLDTFQKILESHIEPEPLLHQLCYSSQDVMEILNNDSSLLGILLGYGKINSTNFERKVSLCHDLIAKMTPPFSAQHDMQSLQPFSRYLVDLYTDKTCPYPSKECFPSPQDTSLAEELNDILSNEDVFELYGSNFFLDKMITPVFAARKETPETKKLHDDYLATKQQLHKTYQNGSFLEITLNQWMYPQ